MWLMPTKRVMPSTVGPRTPPHQRQLVLRRKLDDSGTIKRGSKGMTLRLLWPQWQGAGDVSIRQLASELPFAVARRGYAVGSAVFDAVLPAHGGPRPLLDWLAGRGCSRVAIDFDVDAIDSHELVLGLGAVPGGLTSALWRRRSSPPARRDDAVLPVGRRRRGRAR